MIKLKKLLQEAFVWDRKFGEPLPTLKTILDKVEEGPDDVRKAKRQLQMLSKEEAKLRDRMFKIEQILLQDPRPENQKLRTDLKKSYKDGVTKFMRDANSIIQQMK